MAIDEHWHDYPFNNHVDLVVLLFFLLNNSLRQGSFRVHDVCTPFIAHFNLLINSAGTLLANDYMYSVFSMLKVILYSYLILKKMNERIIDS